MTRKSQRRRRGFTLLEALLALVLATLLFGGIALYTGTWLQQWERLVQRGTQEDVVAIVLDRIVEDLEETQPVYAKDAMGERIVFEGGAQSVTFLRPALGFEPRPGLDRVTYLNGAFGGGPAIMRSRRDFDPSDRGGEGEDLPLIRGNVQLEFAYAGADGTSSASWSDSKRLPSLIRVELSGERPRRWRQFAYARLRVEMPANCGAKDAFAACRDRIRP